MFHVVLRQSGPAWDSSRPMEEQSDWPAHAAFIRATLGPRPMERDALQVNTIEPWTIRLDGRS